jgi:hypothetical protein
MAELVMHIFHPADKYSYSLTRSKGSRIAKEETYKYFKILMRHFFRKQMLSDNLTEG